MPDVPTMMPGAIDVTEMVPVADIDANPHDLRHTAATRLFVIDRWNPAEVQKFLGQRDPRVTLAIYTHINADDLPAPSRLSTG